jgi:peptidoglycan/LPS O-acetylase OafA/YrhL
MRAEVARADAFRHFGSGGLGRLDGLDGVRALAVLAVVFFHGNWSWMKGGYLGVSLFFTLSGFLITSLLLLELGGEGVSFRRFWTRRFRRLLPAAWLTLVAVVAAGWVLLDASQVNQVRGDVVASLLQVANWRFLLSGSSYGALFQAPSPVLHFWSLSIEEQFYLVYPLLLAGLALALGRRRVRLGVVLAVGALASWFVPVLLGASVDRIYYGTDTRAGELLAGAVLAVIVSHSSVRRHLLQRFWPRLLISVAAVVALLATVAAWVLVENGSSLLSSGGLAVVSMLSVLVITGAAVPYGAVSRLCHVSPLRWLGRVSYGVYLFHWPLFVYLDERRTGLAHLPRFLLAVGITLLLAELSFRFVEQPIRTRRGLFAPGRLRPAMCAPVVLIALIAGLLTMSPSGHRQTFDFASAQRAFADQRRQSRDHSATTATRDSSVKGASASKVPDAPPPKLSVFGDSVMLSIGLLIGSWQHQGAPLTMGQPSVELGCGIARYGKRKVFTVESTKPDCDSWGATWAGIVRGDHPDMVVVAPGQWELVDHLMRGDSVWRHMGDPTWDAYVKSELLAANDVLASNGALVVWLNVPDYGTVDAERLPAWQRQSHDPARVARLNQILAEVVAERPTSARLVDLRSWMEPRRDDTNLRDDGTHYNWSGQDDMVTDYLGPQLLATWRDWWQGLYRLRYGIPATS